MQAPAPIPAGTELHAAVLQAAITAALAGLCAVLYRRYRKPYLAWWAAAWLLYLLRIGALVSFLTSANWNWLYWHQVLSGWTALALLGGALVFAQRLRHGWLVAALALFPPLWSWIAIYRLEVFLWAALPAVLFLSVSALGTGAVFLRHARLVGSSGAGLLAAAFFLWGLHHLDYPFLRARGAWSPWGYYLDILFALAAGAGIVLLVLDELQRGLAALSALSNDLQRGGGEREVLDALLGRPLTLPGVRGSALWRLADGGAGAGSAGRFVRGAGACADWPARAPAEPLAGTIAAALARGRPEVASGGVPAYGAVLPIYGGARPTGALVLVGDARDPFTALDDAFLVALGRQVGAALEQAELRRHLEARTAELARLSARTVEQHEEERRRLSRELHDETAQVFSAVKMELGVLRDGLPAALPAAQDERLGRALDLVDAGIRSIRRVVNDLRPSLLDDLGLLPACRSLVAEFGERCGIAAALAAPPQLPPLSKEAELALFRALQEALTNVRRHADATRVSVALTLEPASDGGAGRGQLRLVVDDDGRGLPAADEHARVRLLEQYERDGHLGLVGMRERLAALGGAVRCESAPGAGLRLEIRLPVSLSDSGASAA
jgi:signal transduction histidine kinase